jgi:protein-disulfide isomerase
MSSTGQQGRPTRKEQREQARAERKALEQQQTEQQARRKRLMQIGGIVGVAIVVIAVVVAISASGGGSTAPTSNTQSSAKKAQTEVTALLAGIPQSGNVLGNPNAPVTLQYFGDLQCPICRDFTLGALPTVIEKYVRAGKLKIQYRSMQTATREPAVFNEQQTAALAAGKQNTMWHYVELFYHQQGEEDSGYVTPKFLRERAEQIPGLNVAKWEEERHNPKLGEEIEKDKEAVGENGFTGTPSFLLGKTGGATHKIEANTTPSLEEASALFEPEINKALKG